MPIIGVDYECNIIQSNQKAENMFVFLNNDGENEKLFFNDGKTKVFDMLKKGKLAGSEITQEKLKSFLHDCLGGTKHTFDSADKSMHLSLRCIPRRDRENKKVILGAYFVFNDKTIKKTILKTPLPFDKRTLDAGEVLVTSDRSVINKSHEAAYHVSLASANFIDSPHSS
jgi:hypothetical protein